MENLRPNARGTLAERAAFDLVGYFKFALAPASLTDEDVQAISGIAENIINAAVEEAESRMQEIVARCVNKAMRNLRESPD